MKKFKITYYICPDGEDNVVYVEAKTKEDACVMAKSFRKEPFSIKEVKAAKRKEYVYIAIKLDKNGAPMIAGVFREENDANNVAYSGDFWGNVIKRELE